MKYDVCYVLPSLYPSGGNKIAIEHVTRLVKRGRKAVVSIVSKGPEDDAEWLKIQNVEIIPFTKKSLEECARVVATYWETYFHIKNLKLEGVEFYYFVQSKEEEFESNTLRKIKVIQSLMDKEFSIFTEARWIQGYLFETIGRNSQYVPNHIELPDSFSLERKENKVPVVLIEGEATTTWKNIIDGARVALALKGIAHTVLLTNTPYSKIPLWYYSCFREVKSKLSWEDSLEEIKNADVLYRPSLLEGFNGAMSEAMLLGTPVVVNSIPASFESGVNEWNCLMVQPHDVFSAVGAIKRLLVDKDLRLKIVGNAKETAKVEFTNWDTSIKILEEQVFNFE